MPELSFNPCFDGWGSPTFYCLVSLAQERHVSILVLMDGARRHARISQARDTALSFNPCFDGWGSPTRQRDIRSAAIP